MKVAILDDYFDTIRGLPCYAKLNGHDVTVFTDHVEDLNTLAERLRDFEAVVLIRERTAMRAPLPARPGRISKRGSASARWALVESAWSVVGQPGPLGAFYERTKARRGHGKAIVAVARELAVLFWCLLSRGEDYAHQQPSLTAQKLRRLELAAGAPTVKGKQTGV